MLFLSLILVFLTMSDSDEDAPALSAHTLAALQDFYRDTSSSSASDQFTVGAVGEDWLAEEAVREAGEGGRIACVSAPSVYQKLKQGSVSGSDRVSAVVLEYDRRFSTYGEDFLFYDYNEPLALSNAPPQSFDFVIADPPYLSEECLTKVAQTVKYLSKGKVLLCTELLDVKMCSFLPKHNKNLSNEFRCFVNYPSRLLS
ncbi:hypothetical protein F7725_002361 [Dissostichus mawsoni]|uniref:N(6)-adenine-specific DNA methyltransferase 2 n=1 Tax=Dissostichus mawsoni TaxID=36200 RepID=A0A7J5Y252_DISMA|nr:hypothetical protein F7725_002361 [Dissostichus mawsoni]